MQTKQYLVISYDEDSRTTMHYFVSDIVLSWVDWSKKVYLTIGQVAQDLVKDTEMPEYVNHTIDKDRLFDIMYWKPGGTYQKSRRCFEDVDEVRQYINNLIADGYLNIVVWED